MPSRVLVVDDTAQIRELIALNLELEGFEVHQAAGGSSCLQVVYDLQPDVITLDGAMPDLDGWSTLAALRSDSRTAQVPVVMVTARAQGGDIRRGNELGANAYITKPFDPDALVEIVRGLASS